MIIELPRGRGALSGTKNVEFHILERAILAPKENAGEWDSRPAIVYTAPSKAPMTIDSLRALLNGIKRIFNIPESTPLGHIPKAQADVLDAPKESIKKKDNALESTEDTSFDVEEYADAVETITAGEKANIHLGLRRSVITKMELRDQPILDRYQDEIFRLRLNQRLLLLGPPGTGKTTTLIRRLGQKIQTVHLTLDEQHKVEAIKSTHELPHHKSWLMFTPTKLLKQYLKEAFAREGVPASDLQIHTWEDFQRKLARDTFGFLRTAAKNEGFVVQNGIGKFQPKIEEQLTRWYDDFESWQRSAYRQEVITIAKIQLNSVDSLVNKVDNEITMIQTRLKTDFLTLSAGEKEKLNKRVELLKKTQSALPEYHSEMKFFADSHTSLPLTAILSRLGRMKSLTATINRAQKTVPEIFATPVKYYFSRFNNYYRKFRQQRLHERRWYSRESDEREIFPLELDILLLAALRSVVGLWNNVDSSIQDYLNLYRGIFRSQILVDEATDFSPIQLACMAALAHPEFRSFFACGDFNQRITTWGARSEENMRWVSADFNMRNVNIAYRQSMQLNALAMNVIGVVGGAEQQVNLPDDVDNNGVSPVLLEYGTGESMTDWLAERICEIERFTEQLPSIAVFVNSEAEVASLASDLDLKRHPLQHRNPS